MKVLKASSGLGIGSILGALFILVGILLILNLTNFDLPLDLGKLSIPLQYGAALGSILGGISMLFKRKKEEVPVAVK